MRDGGRRGHAAEAEAPALDLLDEYWFFSNTLVKNGRGRRPPLLPKSPSTSGKCGDRLKGEGAGAKGGSDQAGTSRLYASGCRRLLRTPSLPSPRVGMDLSKDEEIAEEEEEAGGDQEVAEVEDDDLNWSSIYEGVLRTRIAEGGGGGGRSALHRAPSMPVPSSATMNDDRRGESVATKSTLSTSRLRHSYSTLERHCRSHTPTKADRTPRTSSGGGEWGQPRRELRSFSANQQPAIVRYKSAFQDRKWKSSSDLESIEVQGFKDLGFVFDQEELRETLADVLPGLRGKTKTPSGRGSDNDDVNSSGNASAGGDGSVRRPYLSEAWHHVQRSAPPAMIRLQQADARSAAKMKDQIRMWAQAVACNVRQEC